MTQEAFDECFEATKNVAYNKGHFIGYEDAQLDDEPNWDVGNYIENPQEIKEFIQEAKEICDPNNEYWKQIESDILEKKCKKV